MGVLTKPRQKTAPEAVEAAERLGGIYENGEKVGDKYRVKWYSDNGVQHQMNRNAALLLFLTILTQTGCVVVGGYSSTGGWYLWPGSIVITLIFLGLFLMLRRRGR